MGVVLSFVRAAVQSAWVQDVGALAFTLVGSLVWVKMFRELTHRGVLDQVFPPELTIPPTSPVILVFECPCLDVGDEMPVSVLFSILKAFG